MHFQLPVNSDFPLRFSLLSNCVTETSRCFRPSVIFDQCFWFRFSSVIMGRTHHRSSMQILERETSLWLLKKCLLYLSRECQNSLPHPSPTQILTPECQVCPWGWVNVLSLSYIAVLYFILILACNCFSCSRPPWQVPCCKSIYLALLR